MRYSVADIARLTGGELRGNSSRVIRHLVTDTRHIDWPEQSIFIALKGDHQDGHQFLFEAHASGIRAFLVKELPADIDFDQNDTIILVNDPLTALQQLAAAHRKYHPAKVVAITGSNGKTIVKEWLAQCLQNNYKTVKSPKSYNSQLGVPLSVSLIEPEHEWAVMEAGISRPGEMDRLEHILHPDIGILTYMGGAHQEHFETTRQKIREKLILFRHSSVVYACGDQPEVQEELKKLSESVTVLIWAHRKEADLVIEKKTKQGNSTCLTGHFHGKPVTLTIPFTDTASIWNLTLIWLFWLDQGMDPVEINHYVHNLEPIAMRLEQRNGMHGCTLINDSYNSDIQSLKIALDLLFQQTAQEKKTVILSDILQSGIPEEQLYHQVSKLLNRRRLHRIIGIGTGISRYSNLFHAPIQTFQHTEECLEQIGKLNFQQEAILLKGARKFRFERISQGLELQVHQTFLEINMPALKHNLDYFRSLLHPDTRIMVMVKALSYGSGGYELARFLAHERVDYLGVAFIDEALALRRAGVTLPVMVMNPDFQQSRKMIENHLEPVIFNFTGWEIFTRQSNHLGVTHYPVHIKVDTGMHRLGFTPEEIPQLIERALNQQEIRIRGLFTHLSSAEDPAADAFTREQIRRFRRVSRRLTAALKEPFINHVLNSAGIQRHSDAQMDLVRLGIGLYGYGYDPDHRLIPVATLKTVITQIHDLQKGELVGYGQKTRLERPSRIAVLPLGYADGLDRRLGNGNYRMLWNEQLVPTIGHICMDMCMLDVTGTSAAEGDQITVFGEELTITRLADQLETIPYEILTAVPSRVKRIYLFD
ncbi:MAG: bifunctional UDP-N-acetylmuramoyl-tripeptide:D-alanyl-D-alanine ligase/alanine racemase [Bacteroidales bacterium]|nr:bifunctional UDP-N-acetylmuramoyl-tripeptide:D-alanyl-D-alanine ligase/alanine racemase [Bacteroidales bacterium]